MDSIANQGYLSGSRRRSLPSMLMFLIFLLVFGAIALLYGTDSRPGFDERRDGERFGALR